MATKEEDFKQRFAVLFKDLQNEGQKDAEAMWLIGSLAARICDSIKQKTWSGMKAKLSQPGFLKLLGEIDADRKALKADGQTKPAYALQALAMSLAARTHADRDVQTGDKLLDRMIDTALLAYRKSADQKHGAKWG